MKRCPRCNRIYTDDTFQFCLEDGADLAAVSEEQETTEFKVAGAKRAAAKGKWLAFSLIGGTIVLIIFSLSIALLYFVFRPDGRQELANNSNGSTPIFNSSSGDETELKNIMQKLSAAFIENDTKTLDYYLADEYREENSNGESYTKEDAMKPATVEERESLKYSDLKVAIDGEKATVSGKGELKYSLLGVPVTQKFNFKSQFVKRESHWQSVHSYSEYID